MAILAILSASNAAWAQSASLASADIMSSPHLPNAPASFDALANGAGVDWTGPNFGVNFSVGSSGYPMTLSNTASLKGFGASGFGYGATMGYDYQFQNGIVAGVAADLNGPRAAAQFSDTNSMTNASVSQRSSWALRGRIGATLGEETLAYGTLGVATASESAGMTNPVTAQRWRGNYTGLVVGVGVETKVTEEVFLRTEYLRGQYPARTYDGGALSVSPWSDEFRIGLIYRPQLDSGGGSAPTVAAQKVDWSGAVVGALAGPQFSKSKLTIAPTTAVNGMVADGASLAAVAGYGVLSGNLYGGGEMELGSVNSAISAAVPTSGTASVSSTYQVAARARAGVAMAMNTLLYITGGWSFEGGAAALTSPTLGLSDHSVIRGPQLGLGLDTMFSTHVGARLEYLQTFYSPQAAGAVAATAGVSRAGLLYHF